MLTKQQFRDLCNAEMGKPYIWGGEGPDGYDCSGLTQHFLQKLNLDPPGDQTAEGLYRHFATGERSRSVPADESALGDLIFFGDETSVSHVAIGWGDKSMFEAGGGGRTTTTPAAARARHAEVRIRPIARRDDLVAVLRPALLQWSAGALEDPLANGYGRFDGEPVTRWLSDGRHMQLVNPFGYTRDSGEQWPVPELTIVDGASIPRVLWSLIGGPFEGPYRNASIVHDYYCDEKTRSWKETHKIFFEGMMCGGVAEARAKLMYYAVYRFGPRWKLEQASAIEGALLEGKEVAVETPVEAFEPATFEADAKQILARNPTLEEVERLADAHTI